MTTASGTELLLRRTEFDDWRSLTIGIYMALAGYAVMVGLPVISSSWVNHLGFTEEQVGYVASADLFGLAIGAVIAYFVVARFDRRMLTFVSAGVAIAANLLCIFYQSYEVTLWLRLAAGTGAGVYTGIAVATIGGHSRPAFAFGMELFAFAGSQGAELKFLCTSRSLPHSSSACCSSAGCRGGLPTARSMSKSASRSKAANTIPSTATCRLMCPGWCSRRLC
jgi:hypothetical protein